MPPAFEPPAEALVSHAKIIEDYMSKYQSASSPAEKEAALSKISSASTTLAQASTSPAVRLQQFNFQAHANAVVRVGMEMGLFAHLSSTGSITLSELAAKCDAEVELTMRIARAIGSLGMLQEVSPETYAANAMSKMLNDPNVTAMYKHMIDNVAPSMLHLNDFFRQNGYKSPADPKNGAFVSSKGAKDILYFDYLQQHPPLYEQFNQAMGFHNVVGAKEIARTYPFNDLQPGADGVALVDVGGGQGHVLAEIIEAHPNIAGHAILEDLESVVESKIVVPSGQAKLQSYDFIKQQQPIVGPAALLFRHILHDWPDSACITILRHQIEAMKGHQTKLLISETVIPDSGGPPNRVLRDINMMQLSGKERSYGQWSALLDQAGFRIVKIYGPENVGNSIIEAVLK